MILDPSKKRVVDRRRIALGARLAGACALGALAITAACNSIFNVHPGESTSSGSSAVGTGGSSSASAMGGSTSVASSSSKAVASSTSSSANSSASSSASTSATTSASSSAGGADGGTSCPPKPTKCATDGAHDYNSDAANCCVAGRSCQSGQCIDGACQEVVLFSDTSGKYDAYGVVVEGGGPSDRIIWAGGPGNVLYTIPKQPITTPNTFISLAGSPVALTLDNSHMFATWFDDGDAHRVTIKGPIVSQVLAMGGGGSRTFGRVAAHAGWVYWTTRIPPMPGGDPGSGMATGHVWAAQDGGSAPSAVTVAAPTDAYTGGVAADDTYVYWTERMLDGSAARLRRAAILAPGTFGSPQTIDTEPGDHEPQDIALDDTYVFWTTSSTLRAVVKDLSIQPGELAPSSPQGLVVDDDYVYWLEGGEDVVRRIPKLGGAFTNVGTARGGRAITQDCGAIYWTSGDSSGVSVRMLVK